MYTHIKVIIVICVLRHKIWETNYYHDIFSSDKEYMSKQRNNTFELYICHILLALENKI